MSDCDIFSKLISSRKYAKGRDFKNIVSSDLEAVDCEKISAISLFVTKREESLILDKPNQSKTHQDLFI